MHIINFNFVYAIIYIWVNTCRRALSPSQTTVHPILKFSIVYRPFKIDVLVYVYGTVVYVQSNFNE